MRWVTTNSSLLFYSYNIPLCNDKNYKPTIFRFVYINIIKIAIFHVYGRHFVFQNGRPYPNFQKNS